MKTTFLAVAVAGLALGGISVLLFIYLIVAMLRPEKF